MQTLTDVYNRALYAPLAEADVIGSMLINDRAARKVTFLSENDFSSDDLRRCFAACMQLLTQKTTASIVTLDAQLSKMYPKERAETALEAAIEAMASTPSSAMVENSAMQVREAAIKRKLRDVGEHISRMASDPTIEINDTLERIRSEIRDVGMPGDKSVSMSEFTLRGYESLERRARGEVQTIKTGIKKLDEMMGGIRNGEMTIVGGRPRIGKSILGLQIALEASLQGKHALLVSLEMSDEQMWQRVYSRQSMVDGMRIRDGAMRDSDWDSVAHAVNEYGSIPISYEFEISYLEDLRAEAQRKRDRGECDILIVDYVQLLETRGKTYNDTERVGMCSRSIKRMTRELKIPIIAVAQVNRDSDNDGHSKCPQLHNLRSSGQLEQDADNVILLHNPDWSGDNTVNATHKSWYEQNVNENSAIKYQVMNVAKVRQGRTGLVQQGIDMAHMRYFDV